MRKAENGDAGNKPGFRMGLRIVAAILLVASPFAIYPKTTQYLESRDSPNWPTVEGLVTEHQGYEVTYKGNVSRAAFVKYQYTVDGKKYQGTAISPAMSKIMEEDAERMEKYKPGSRPAVYYAPSDPGTAYLEPGSSPTAIFGSLIPWALPALAIALFLYSRKSSQPKKTEPDDSGN